MAAREDYTNYYHEVSRFDHFVGLVRDELERLGVLENTLLVVGSDNGRPFPRAKSRLYDSGIKTPWVVHFPKLIQQGAVTRSFVSSIDLSATCLELAGVKIPEAIQGRSFLPILKDPKATLREVVFAEQKVVAGRKEAGGNPHAEFPGAARNATKINHPGPLSP